VIGQSVLGAAHRRAGVPNQDALGWYPEGGAGPPVILAVADGHGGAKYFRSRDGARLAVDAARAVAQELLLGPGAGGEAAALKDRAERLLPRELGERWVTQVSRDLEGRPFSGEELETLEKKEGSAARRAVEDAPVLAYGSTLLAVVVADSFVAYLRLGDGDVLAVSAAGDVGRPLPGDPRLLGVETTSLSSAHDRAGMAVCFEPLGESPPAMILVCTDGYANSYPGHADPVAELAEDLWVLVGDHGPEAVQANLEEWLAETTAQGSGDDITLGCLCRLDAFSGLDGRGATTR
jgi:serine/threonine protein phosphatase PrpC